MSPHPPKSYIMTKPHTPSTILSFTPHDKGEYVTVMLSHLDPNHDPEYASMSIRMEDADMTGFGVEYMSFQKMHERMMFGNNNFEYRFVHHEGVTMEIETARKIWNGLFSVGWNPVIV